ncbi:MAG: restriction endonuclease [Bdellovibrionales bacterium]
MTIQEFEALLNAVTIKLTQEAAIKPFTASKEFENRAREVLKELGKVPVDLDPDAQAFPDIVIGQYGVEVKFTEKDTWRSVANSVFESKRENAVKHIYLLFGKMGGAKPEVKWGRYDECVMHVRTSHMPRFEVEINAEKSLFARMGVTYDEFRQSPLEDKMRRIREYARGRLKEGEHLWWLEDKPEPEHSLSLEVKLYMRLPQVEKRKLRAEAALLCPQIVKPSRSKNKYNDATMYLLTYHGVLCPQARDLFSAGSVALRADGKRGGNYLLRALQDIQDLMIDAAKRLDDALFIEYWGTSCKPECRIAEWLRRADCFAQGWKPSESLFVKSVGRS